jgi:hypothetical protein
MIDTHRIVADEHRLGLGREAHDCFVHRLGLPEVVWSNGIARKEIRLRWVDGQSRGFSRIPTLTEARLQEARALLEASRNDATKLAAAVNKILAEGTAVEFDSTEALMEWLRAGRPDETV